MTTWGDIYNQHLRKGEDHGSAAYCADQWQKRQDQAEERLRVEAIERAALTRMGLLPSAVPPDTITCSRCGQEMECKEAADGCEDLSCPLI